MLDEDEVVGVDGLEVCVAVLGFLHPVTYAVDCYEERRSRLEC